MRLEKVPFGVPFKFIEKGMTNAVWMRLRCVDTKVKFAQITVTALSNDWWKAGDTGSFTEYAEYQVELVPDFQFCEALS